MASRKLYILYNADASVLGKLKYGYRKLRHSTEDNPACAACDVTHGGLSLQETPAWVSAKKEIETQSGLKVIQWHRDEISAEVKSFIAENGIKYPTVLVEKSEGGLQELLTRSDLATCKGNAQSFLDQLRQKGLLSQTHNSVL